MKSQLLSQEALAEGSKKLARILMDENYSLKSQIETLLRPDMAVPSAQEQSKKALSDLRTSYENMFAQLVGKVTQIKQEGEKMPILERENTAMSKELAVLKEERASLTQNQLIDKMVAPN